MKTIPTLLALAAAAVAAGCTAPGPLSPFAAPAGEAAAMDTGTLYALGRQLHGQQRYDEALRTYGQLLAQEPDHVDALNAAGAIHSMQGRAQEAEAAFRRAIAAQPRAARSYNNLGYHLLRMNRPSEALTQLEQARARAPRDEQVAVNIAMARARLSPDETAAATPPAALAAAAPAPAPSQPQPTVALARIQDGIYELRNAPAAAAVPAAAGPVAQPATPKAVRIEVSNGNGTTGLARRVAQAVAPGSRLTNSRPFGTAASRIQYTAGFEHAARDIGARLAVPVPLAQVDRLDRANVRVLLGKDFPRGTAAVAVASSEPAQPSLSQP